MIELSDSHGSLLQWLVASSYIVGDLAVTQTFIFCVRLLDTVTLADALAGHYWPGASGNYLFTKESWKRAGRYHEFVGGGIDSWAFGIRQLATGSKMHVLHDTGYYHRYGHESAWTRDLEVGNVSLKALQILIPFLDLIDESDVEYIMSRKGRYNWFQNLEKHPLRLRDGTAGRTGVTTLPPPSSPSFETRIHRYAAIWSTRFYKRVLRRI